MAGNFFKSVGIAEGHINAAFILTFQHEDRQLFPMRQVDDVLIDRVGTDHFAKEQDAGQIRNVEGRHKLPDAFFSPGFNAVPVESDTQRQVMPGFRRVNQAVQDEVQVFHIFPGSAHGNNPAILMIHGIPPIVS